MSKTICFIGKNPQYKALCTSNRLLLSKEQKKEKYKGFNPGITKISFCDSANSSRIKNNNCKKPFLLNTISYKFNDYLQEDNISKEINYEIRSKTGKKNLSINKNNENSLKYGLLKAYELNGSLSNKVLNINKNNLNIDIPEHLSNYSNFINFINNKNKVKIINKTLAQGNNSIKINEYSKQNSKPLINKDCSPIKQSKLNTTVRQNNSINKEINKKNKNKINQKVIGMLRDQKELEKVSEGIYENKLNLLYCESGEQFDKMFKKKTENVPVCLSTHIGIEPNMTHLLLRKKIKVMKQKISVVKTVFDFVYPKVVTQNLMDCYKNYNKNIKIYNTPSQQALLNIKNRDKNFNQYYKKPITISSGHLPVNDKLLIGNAYTEI